MFAGSPGGARLLTAYRVTHVYVGPGEVRDFGANVAWFRERYREIATFDGVAVFDVRASLPSAVAAR